MIRSLLWNTDDIQLVKEFPTINSVFGLEKVVRWNPITISAIQSTPRSMRFLGFSDRKKGAPRQEISKWSTVCNTFSRSGWSVVRNTSLTKGGTLKKRPSTHLHKVPTRCNKLSPRTFQKALVYYKPPYYVVLYPPFFIPLY
jgi:hypothetical protein